ncbi:uncharacterized protein BO87DRAFT_445060 [Aspergillus neoniger CBS 115656]|uniref:Uncharacterized protein n=1 Tax=Aspergillus neoniger (strain CBS 115656) TaxID=1448310 RepID=A0A318Y7S8_ASPNB|nr:hypothetical protein BO87DRAFT_445060 [Aspergillus neoniger CBS 115656]PYH30365.1 hypothetical protein BO87DRAFT_445060 [Aspergillus neoniger CBS 115656]
MKQTVAIGLEWLGFKTKKEGKEKEKRSFLDHLQREAWGLLFLLLPYFAFFFVVSFAHHFPPNSLSLMATYRW